MRRLDDIITQLQALQPDLRRRYPIRSLGVFGSYVRGEQREDSDLDLLVETGEGMTLPDYVGLQMELTEALGVKVDLADKAALRRRIGQRILAEVRML
jgi:predicted nucleotidyltransferase